MRILVSFLAALALLTTQSVEAQSAEAKNSTEATAVEAADDTAAKTSCHDEVEVARLCFDWSGPDYIEVKVDNCNPKGLDWIAIYDADSSNEVGYNKGYHYWGDSKDWTFVCGSRTCDHPTSYNYLYFHDWWDNELLVNGEYKIYLFRDNTFLVDAESETFTVKNKYHYCGGHPTHSPGTHKPTHHPTPSHKPVTHHPTPHPTPSHKPVTHHPTPHPTPSNKPNTHKPTHHPTPSNKPVAPHPTHHPTTTPGTKKPTLFPTFSPTGFCPQDTTEKFTLWSSGKEKKCKWAGKKKNKVDKRCNQRTSEPKEKVRDVCPRTCKACGSSSD